MPRKFKTYVTSVGFFEQAVAAPSMKAALEAWGAQGNLFQQGFANETDDPAIVAATMAKPGVILKRAVGSKGPFAENAALPKTLPAERHGETHRPPTKTKPEKTKPATVVNLADARAAKQAAAAFEKEQARREREQAKEEAARAKERERRDEAIRKAEAALEKAKQRHDNTESEIAAARTTLDRRAQTESSRWDKEKEKLEDDLLKARQGH